MLFQGGLPQCMLMHPQYFRTVLLCKRGIDQGGCGVLRGTCAEALTFLSPVSVDIVSSRAPNCTHSKSFMHHYAFHAAGVRLPYMLYLSKLFLCRCLLIFCKCRHLQTSGLLDYAWGLL